MLTYSFDHIGTEHLYEHLYSCIKKDILDGTLRTGEKLPSKRALAAQLNLSTITIETAYSQLAAEGYIQSKPKSGWFVCPVVYSGQHPSQSQRIQKTENLRIIADFVENSATPQSFPFHTWARLMKKCMIEQPERLLAKTPGTGAEELRQALCEHLKHFRGMSVNPDQIVIGAGSEYLYGLIVRLLGPQRTYCLEEPGYPKIRQIYRSNGAHCVYVPLETHGINIKQVEAVKADVVHISPAHHFPTGITMPAAHRYELLRWASEREGRFIIEDDYDSEFRFSGTIIPTMQSIDLSERVIYLNTFSKTLSPSIRISYMVLPKPLIRRYAEQLDFLSCTVPTFEQYTLAAFITGGWFEKHLNRLRTYYKKKRTLLLDAIQNSPLATKTDIMEESSGLHFLLRLHTDITDNELKERFMDAGIRLSFLAHYYEHAPDSISHIVVINYSNIAEEHIKEAIMRINSCF